MSRTPFAFGSALTRSGLRVESGAWGLIMRRRRGFWRCRARATVSERNLPRLESGDPPADDVRQDRVEFGEAGVVHLGRFRDRSRVERAEAAGGGWSRQKGKSQKSQGGAKSPKKEELRHPPTGRVGVEVLLEPTPDGKRHPDPIKPALLAPQALDDLVQALDRAGHVGRAEGDRGEGGRVERGGEEAELVDVQGAEARAEFQRRAPAEVGQLAPVAAVAEDVSSTSPGKTGPLKRPHQSDKPPSVPLAPTGPTSSANLLTSIVARSTFTPVEAAVGNAAGGGGAPTRLGEVVPPEVNERTAVWKSRPIEQSGKTAGISPTPTSRCRTAVRAGRASVSAREARVERGGEGLGR